MQSNDVLLHEAELAGQGVAIDRGTIVRLFDASTREECNWLVCPARVFERSARALFRNWLLAVVSGKRDRAAAPAGCSRITAYLGASTLYV